MAEVKVTVVNNGPLLIDGEVEIVDQDGHAYGLAAALRSAFAAADFRAQTFLRRVAQAWLRFQSVVQAQNSRLRPPSTRPGGLG